MIKYIFFLFLFSMGLLCPLEAIASGGYTHTYTTPALELKPISSIENSYQTAAVCFLGVGDCQQGGYDKGDDDMDVDSAKQCQNEGYIYTTKNCLLPSFLDKPCGYNEAYFAECNKDIPRACTEAGYKKVSSCASGQKLKASPRCQWDNSYGICCKETCPANSSLTCGGANAGDDTCGYICKKCCSDACPSGQQLYYSGANGSKTECGNQCKRCNTTCPSGSSTSYSGSSVGTNECGNSCRSCSTSCPSGSYEYRTGSGSCGGSTTRDECGSKTCFYPYETCPCYPSCSSEGGCSCGSYTISNGCGGSCTRCNACCSETCSGQSSPCSSSQIQTSSCSLKCSSGTRYTCQAKPSNPWRYYQYPSSGNSFCGTNNGKYWAVCYGDMYCVNGGTSNFICQLSYAFGKGFQPEGWGGTGYNSIEECQAAGSRSCSSLVSPGDKGECQNGTTNCHY